MYDVQKHNHFILL